MRRTKEVYKEDGVREWYLGRVKTEYKGEEIELLEDETVQKEYSNGKDIILFTNKRFIIRVYNVDNVMAEDEISIPYKSIHMWATSRNRDTGQEGGFSLWTASGEMRLLYLPKEDAKEFNRILSRECL